MALRRKYDFGADAFNTNDFTATEATLNTVMLAYNLMSLFKRVVVKSCRNQGGQTQQVHQTLKTLRYKIFAKPAYITQDGRRRIWNLVMGMQKTSVDARHVELRPGLRNTRSFHAPALWITGQMENLR